VGEAIILLIETNDGSGFCKLDPSGLPIIVETLRQIAKIASGS
jgi:hypothetical protein